jgi:DNA-binding NarL/FixJ family response regulator
MARQTFRREHRTLNWFTIGTTVSSARRRIGVLIADDHRTFAEALRIALARERDLRVVGVVSDGEAAADSVGRDRPDVVLMDVEMPGTDGIEATRRIRDAVPDTRVIVLTAHEDDLTLARALEAGAAGYLSKTGAIDQVPRAVRQVHHGEPIVPADEAHRLLRHLRHRRSQEATQRQRVERLTPRETEILQHMADGESPSSIADALGLSPHTLRTHVQNVLTKLGVHSKIEALAVALRHGKVTSRSPTGAPIS